MLHCLSYLLCIWFGKQKFFLDFGGFSSSRIPKISRVTKMESQMQHRQKYIFSHFHILLWISISNAWFSSHLQAPHFKAQKSHSAHRLKSYCMTETSIYTIHNWCPKTLNIDILSSRMKNIKR